MSQKKEASLLRLVLVLTTIALVAGLALTGIYALTKEPIDNAQKEKKENALNAVLPGFKGQLKDTTVTLEGDDEGVLVHLAIQEDGTLFGAGIETYTKKAFSGRFDLMVGLDANGSILNTEVISASETPGLGDNINKKEGKYKMKRIRLNRKADHRAYARSARKTDIRNIPGRIVMRGGQRL